MGCGGSQFTDDETKFFKRPIPRDLNYMCEDLVKKDDILRLVIDRDLYKATEEKILKTKDGSEFLKIVPDKGKKKICDKDGVMLALLTFSIRNSEVNVVDDSFIFPHIYIYSSKAFRQGQQKEGSHRHSAVDDDGKTIYLWARVHKVGNVGTPKFEVCMAELEAGSAHDENNDQKFGAHVYVAAAYKDGRLEIKKYCAGVLTGCTQCNKGMEEDAPYDAAIAANTDPTLVVCTIMAIDALRDR